MNAQTRANEVRNKLAKRIEELGLMTAPPKDPAEYKRAGDWMWIIVTLYYKQNASARDFELLAKPPRSPDPEYQVALKSFHESILEQAAVWGWRMDMSSEIVKIKSQWEALNADMLRRYGKQQSIESKISRGEARYPFPARIEEFADGAILELKAVFHMARVEFAKRKVPPRCSRIAEWIKAEVESRPADFPWIYPCLGKLFAYIVHLPAVNAKAATELESGRVRADSFFYLWYAISTRRTVPDVRNQISRRRQALKRSSLK